MDPRHGQSLYTGGQIIKVMDTGAWSFEFFFPEIEEITKFEVDRLEDQREKNCLLLLYESGHQTVSADLKHILY